MSNMAYCRFQNTLSDLRDCRDHMDVPLETDEEIEARIRLVKLCELMADEYGESK